MPATSAPSSYWTVPDNARSCFKSGASAPDHDIVQERPVLLRTLLLYVSVATKLAEGVYSLQAKVLKDARQVVGVRRGLLVLLAQAGTYAGRHWLQRCVEVAAEQQLIASR